MQVLRKCESDKESNADYVFNDGFDFENGH